MNFNLGIDTTAIWYADVHTSTGAQQLWSKSISAVVPPAAFTLTFGFPGLTKVGELEIISGLETAQGVSLCAEAVNLNTAQ
jgi:hypothetical protein